MSQRRKLLRMQRFCLLQSHCEWLDAQAQAGINDSRIAQAAVSEFLYEIQEEERQCWITGRKKNLTPVSILSFWVKLFGWSVESFSGSLDEPPDILQTLWATSFCYPEHSRASVPHRKVDAESAILLRPSPDQIV
jgi:hypothetical protein